LGEGAKSMRRFLGPVLIGLGAFLLVAAVLLKFYAYPQVAVAPIDQNSTTYLEATNATVFDTATLEEITTDLSVVSTTRGDVKASEAAGDGVLVWTGTSTVTSSDGVVRSQSAERAAHDEHTGEAVNCCDNFTETTDGEREPVKRAGLVYKFPFGTEKKDYDFWDGTLGDTVKATYEGEEKIQGLTVYVFKTETPATVVGTREVPGSLVGEDADVVDADTVYANTRTLKVEPTTGAVIDRLEEQKQTLAVNGQDVVTTTEADISYTDAQVDELVDEIKGKAGLLGMLEFTLPLLALVLGLLALVAGLLITRRSEPAAPADHRDDKLVGV
jgi:hypothetical protein